MTTNRRQFLASTAFAAAAGANDRVNLALIGCGGRGRYVSGFMRQAPGAQFAAVCDVYDSNAAAAREALAPGAETFKDFRRVLDRKDIDAVVVATPDHWHAAITVLACQSGKHVYVEKPVSHNIREGQAMVAAARSSKRIVQAGTQHRSSAHIAEAASIVRNGELGPVHFVRVWNYVNMTPRGIGVEPDGEPPAGLDWDFYCGPAPLVPFNRKRFLSTYRWFWDYAGGYITDYGTHRFDSVHQIMGVDAPSTIAASGRRYELKDAGEMPDVLQVTYEYPGFVMSYEASNLNGHGVGGRRTGMRYYNARGSEDRPNGMAFYGSNATLFVDRVGYEIYPEMEPRGMRSRDDTSPVKYRMESRQKQGADATQLHAAKFVEVIRSGGAPPATIEHGHRATNIAHLGNIALKTGLKLKWDAKKEDFDRQPEASALLGRKARAPWNFV
jgi:predicted dehydrogenase